MVDISASEAQNQTTRLALPPPNSPSATTQVAVGSTAVKLDELGPMVVNSDGVSLATYLHLSLIAKVTV